MTERLAESPSPPLRSAPQKDPLDVHPEPQLAFRPMGTTKTTKGKAKSVQPSTKKKAAPKASAAAAPEGDTLLIGVRGEREQLAVIRQKLPPLSEVESRAFMAPHSPETCRDKASSTKARDVFRLAMSWARIIGANPTDPGVRPKRARWCLDCASALGELLAGNAGPRNPSVTSALIDAQSRGAKLSAEVRAAALDALGDDRARAEVLRRALTPPARDARAESLRNARKVLSGWFEDEGLKIQLSLHDVNEDTLAELEAAAVELEKATASRGAAQQADRDTPAENEAEGRLLFAMKWVWKDFKKARQNGRSSLVLPVSPAILRGLGIGKSGEDTEEPDEDENP